jgi:hypothetical protein
VSVATEEARGVAVTKARAIHAAAGIAAEILTTEELKK